MATITEQIDREREDAQRWLESEYGATLTMKEIQVGTAAYLEANRRNREAAVRASDFALAAAGRTGESLIAEHVPQGA